MITLQEQFEKDFPDKEVRNISTRARHQYSGTYFTNYDLDLREYANLEKIDLEYSNLTSINLSKCKNLRVLLLGVNNLTSIDFLNTLPNPEKLERLEIYDNNIQPTTLDFLRPFVNLIDCKLGENKSKDEELLKERLKNKIYNKFYGSLEPIKNLTKLEKFCIAGTDVEEGIEYIPAKLVDLNKRAIENKDEYIEKDRKLFEEQGLYLSQSQLEKKYRENLFF